MQILRTFAEPFYKMSTTLDGTDYLFEFRFSQRESCWYFSVSKPDGTLLVAGVKVVCNRSLLSRFADARLPKGRLFAVTTGADASPPKLDELGEGKRVRLVYVTKAELDEIKASEAT